VKQQGRYSVCKALKIFSRFFQKVILPVSFYSRFTLDVLENLIGMVLVRKSEDGLTSGVIVEAENRNSGGERNAMACLC